MTKKIITILILLTITATPVFAKKKVKHQIPQQNSEVSVPTRGEYLTKEDLAIIEYVKLYDLLKDDLSENDIKNLWLGKFENVSKQGMIYAKKLAKQLEWNKTWVELGNNFYGFKPDVIKNNNSISGWVKLLNKNNSLNLRKAKQVNYVFLKFEIIKDSSTIKNVNAIYYDKDNKIIDVEEFQDEFKPVLPNTNLEAIYNWLNSY